MEVEIWKPVKGYEGFYEVSNKGKVRSVTHSQRNSIGRLHNYEGKIIVQRKDKRKGKNYMLVCLSVNGKKVMRQVHRLVAIAFLENPLNLPQVNHKDENPQNNCVDNLEWCTPRYNLNYGNRNAKASISRGKNIVQMDMNGKVLNEFTGARHAARELNLFNADCGNNITACCRGKKKSAYGYKWKFAN